MHEKLSELCYNVNLLRHTLILCFRRVSRLHTVTHAFSLWGLFEEARGFGLWSHQHTGLVLVCDVNLKRRYEMQTVQ